MVQRLTTLLLLMAGLIGFSAIATAQTTEKRVAFVVGNADYAAGALPTAANDAGLVAQTLQAAGFDVVGARDLDAETFRQSYSEFLRRLGASGPETVAFIYIAGYGLQYGNENYIVPIGATITKDLDIPIEAIRLSDLIGPLAGLNLKARFAVFDAAYPDPFGKGGAPRAGGLALVDASPGSLIAFNAAPGTVAPAGTGNYGAYAQALVTEMREGGSPPDVVFDRTRLRVNADTNGAEVPWESSKIDTTFRFFDRGPDAPPEPSALADLRSKPIRDLTVDQAYQAAVDRDTIAGYQDFLSAFGRDPLAKRVRALLAARREAVTWARTTGVDTPDAYWSYLQRYPKGPHRSAAALRLKALAVSFDPQPGFAPIVYDVPPPPVEEVFYIDRPVLYFDDPAFGFVPPPQLVYLPRIPVAFIDLPPPPPPIGLFGLPFPAFVPLATFINPPRFIAPPQNNPFFGKAVAGRPAIHGPLGSAAALIALPAVAERRGAALQDQGIKTSADLAKARAAGQLGALGRRDAPNGRGRLPDAQQLPGANGKALPVPSTSPVARPVVPLVTPNQVDARAKAEQAKAEQAKAEQVKRDQAVKQEQASKQEQAAKQAEAARLAQQRADAAKHPQTKGPAKGPLRVTVKAKPQVQRPAARVTRPALVRAPKVAARPAVRAPVRTPPRVAPRAPPRPAPNRAASKKH